MPSSIFELVALNRLSTLEGITTNAGYEISPLVRRYGTDKSPPARNVDDTGVPYTIELVLQQAETESIEPLTYGKEDHYMHFQIVGLIQQSEATTDQTDTIINQIVASVIKALMADAQCGVFPGGSNPLAINTLIGIHTPLSKAEGGVEGVLIPFKVHVRTAQFDPYNQ